MTEKQIEITCQALEELMESRDETEWNAINETLTAFYALLDEVVDLRSKSL